jgi:uncharacterized protein YcnI
MKRKLLPIASIVAVIGVTALPAMAHIGTTPGEVPAGETSAISFRVGHGCEDSPTVSLAMEVPAGVTSVVPKAKDGWTIEVEEGTLPEPVQMEDETITEGVVRVTWTGGLLDAHQYDEFEIRARMPDAVGETVYFPFVQTCEAGEYAWIEIPAEGGEEPESPAPGVTLTESTGGGDHGATTETTTEAMAAEESPSAETGGATSPLVWAGLGLGSLGAVLGGAAFATSRQGK